MLKLLTDEGFHTKDLPASSDNLMSLITAGPTNWLTDRTTRTGGQRMSLQKYLFHFKALPLEVRNQIETRWGKPENDPFLVRMDLRYQSLSLETSALVFSLLEGIILILKILIMRPTWSLPTII